jgi:predicted dienelactone hydrolase
MSTSTYAESTYAENTVPAPVLSVSPVVLRAPGRPVDLEVRVTVPATGLDGGPDGGTKLPFVLLSHGHGNSNHLSSLHGYAPLASYWAARGFGVLQPTHLDAKVLGRRDADDPQAPLYWRSRAQDMRHILDELDAVEAAVPGLAGRLDRDRVAVAGHSMGGHTASLLLGARLTDPVDGRAVDLAEPRVKAGVLLAAPGRGGDALTEFTAKNYAFFASTDFAAMTTPALVVAGDADPSAFLTTAGAAWHADPYYLSPGRKALLTVFGGGHGLGGVAGWDAAETTDEDPARVAAVAELSLAYLRSELYPGDPAWQQARDALTGGDDPVGRVESR